MEFGPRKSYTVLCMGPNCLLALRLDSLGPLEARRTCSPRSHIDVGPASMQRAPVQDPLRWHVSYGQYWGGALFGSPYNKDHSTLGTSFGGPLFVETCKLLLGTITARPSGLRSGIAWSHWEPIHRCLGSSRGLGKYFNPYKGISRVHSIIAQRILCPILNMAPLSLISRVAHYITRAQRKS